MMVGMRALARALAVTVVFFAAPAAAFSLGLVVRALGERALPALLLLAAEPALWLLLTWVGLHALSQARVLRGLGALVALVALAAGLRAPLDEPGDWETPSEVTPALRTCVTQLDPTQGALRVATFNTGGVADPQALAAAVRATEAQLLVLQELRAPTLARVVEALNQGAASGAEGVPEVEGLFSEAWQGGGLGLLVRGGVFDRCGEDDLWSVPVPAAGGRRAQLALGFARVEGVGSVPLVGMHLDRPARLGELGSWGPNLIASAARAAGLARALGSPALVMMGDTNTHSTFPSFNAALREVGLGAVPPRPSWPARVAGLPALPLYALDRVWAGPSWTLEELRVQRTTTSSDHMAVVVELSAQQ